MQRCRLLSNDSEVGLSSPLPLPVTVSLHCHFRKLSSVHRKRGYYDVIQTRVAALIRSQNIQVAADRNQRCKEEDGVSEVVDREAFV